MAMKAGRLYAAFLFLNLAAGSVPAHAETIRIVIDKLVFTPATVEAKPGDKIEWVNNDALLHTATVRDDWEIIIPAKKTATMVVKDVGDMEYFCRFHPNMKGRIIVTPTKR